jgi:hypothetical protein
MWSCFWSLGKKHHPMLRVIMYCYLLLLVTCGSGPAPVMEEAATDPAIKARRLAMELRPWYGSAALMELNTLHERIHKVGITD